MYMTHTTTFEQLFDAAATRMLRVKKENDFDRESTLLGGGRSLEGPPSDKMARTELLLPRFVRSRQMKIAIVFESTQRPVAFKLLAKVLIVYYRRSVLNIEN